MNLLVPLNEPSCSLKWTTLSSYPDRGTCVLRPRYMRTPTEVHVYPDRGTMTLRYIFTLYSSFPEDFFSKARTYIPCVSESWSSAADAYRTCRCVVATCRNGPWAGGRWESGHAHKPWGASWWCRLSDSSSCREWCSRRSCQCPVWNWWFAVPSASPMSTL